MSSRSQENRPLLDCQQIKSALPDDERFLELFAGKLLSPGKCYTACFYQLGNAAHQLATLERASYKVIANEQAVTVEFENNDLSAEKYCEQQLSVEEYRQGFYTILSACNNDWTAVMLAQDSFFHQSTLACAVGWGNTHAALAILDLLQQQPMANRRAVLNARAAKPKHINAYSVSSSILMLAIQRNEHELCQRLLEFDEIDVNQTDEYGLTALHWAAIMLNGPVIERLIAKGAAQDRQAQPHMHPGLVERLRQGMSPSQRKSNQRQAVESYRGVQTSYGSHTPAAYMVKMVFDTNGQDSLAILRQTPIANILVAHQFYPLFAHFWGQAQPLLILLKQNREAFKQNKKLYRQMFRQGIEDIKKALATPFELPDFSVTAISTISVPVVPSAPGDVNSYNEYLVACINYLRQNHSSEIPSALFPAAGADGIYTNFFASLKNTNANATIKLFASILGVCHYFTTFKSATAIDRESRLKDFKRLMQHLETNIDSLSQELASSRTASGFFALKKTSWLPFATERYLNWRGRVEKSLLKTTLADRKLVATTLLALLTLEGQECKIAKFFQA